jgi:uncharacterized membrane protein (DUF485 family)
MYQNTHTHTCTRTRPCLISRLPSDPAGARSFPSHLSSQPPNPNHMRTPSFCQSPNLGTPPFGLRKRISGDFSGSLLAQAAFEVLHEQTSSCFCFCIYFSFSRQLAFAGEYRARRIFSSLLTTSLFSLLLILIDFHLSVLVGVASATCRSSQLRPFFFF